MALLKVQEIVDWLETDLPDPVLQLYLDDAEAEIVKRFGASTPITEDFFPKEEELYIYPARPISSVTSATEREDATDTVLASNDYRTVHGGRALERLDTGTNQANGWAPEVRLVYVPVSETATRKRVQLDLVRLAIAYRGVKSESAGDYSMTAEDYQAERNRILSALDDGRLVV